MRISDFAIRKPITTVMVALSMLVLGAISLFRLPLEYAPDLSWPSLYISVNYPSSSPEEVERSITRPIEEMMGTLSRVQSISSRSFDSGSSVRIGFDFGTDMDLMSVHVRDRLDQVRKDLPEDVERVSIRRWSTDDWPILNFTLSWLGEDPEELASVYKHVILPRLQRLEGVGSVEVSGLEEKSLLVEVNQELLNAHNLDIRALNWVIRTNNVNVSAGYVEDAGRRLAVRSIGQFEEVSQIRDLPVREDIRLGDVADVTYDYPEAKSFSRMDGRDAVAVSIRKSSTANLVATARLVKSEMRAIQEKVGRNRMQVQIVRDRSIDVIRGIWSLFQSAATGGILAISVIFLFLRSFRSTLIIGSAIPISALCVFIMMYLLRQFFDATITLNLVSMMGLMVAIGMLVDPAVVALENIYRKRYDEGQGALRSALEGSREIAMPVLAAALTTVCVFVPLIFVTETGSSMWMRDFATTVCISVVAALCVALTLVPLAGSRAFEEGGKHVDRWIKAGFAILLVAATVFVGVAVGPSGAFGWLADNAIWFLGGLSAVPVIAWVMLAALGLLLVTLYLRFRKEGLKGLYVRVVHTTLRYRWTTVTAACVLLGFGFYLFSELEKRPYRWQPTRRVTFMVEVPRSYDVKDALLLFGQVEDILMPRKAELDIESISTQYSGRQSSRLTLYLTPTEAATVTTDQVTRRVKSLLPEDIPGVRFKIGRSRGSSSTGVGLELKGRNSEVLAILAEDVKLRMKGIPGVHEVVTSLESGKEEIRVTVSRQRAQRYGLSPQQVATTIATALGTRGSSKYKTEDGEIDITVQLKEEDRATLEQLKNAQFESEGGDLVAFASLADFSLRRGPTTLEREDRMSTVTVFANTEQSARFRVGGEMQRRMEAIPLPSGYSWQMDRRFRRISREQGDTNFTMVFAALLIYLIMASLFESYIHPFTIMFSISFAFTGLAIGLYVFKIPMDSNAYYGLLILFGIVVNNGIVLVDHINRYRQQGLFRRDAIIRGGQDRIRPILMTATTTILGLAPLVIPMIYGTAEGNARRFGPIGLVVVCGLAVSTVLTLVLMPTVYSLMDDLSAHAKRVLASVRSS